MLTIGFYCITLSSREDRRKEIQKEFDRLHIPIEWWIVKKHPQGGKYGCFESHINIWEKNTEDIAVIFEDDVKFDGSPEDFRELLNEGIDLSSKYTTVHLGHIALTLGKKISPNFHEGRFITTSCYLARGDKLRNLLPQMKSFYGCHIDTVLTYVSSQIGLMPYRFIHNFNDSNNSWIKDVPIVALYPNLDQKFREMITEDPYHLLKIPISNGIIKCVLGINIIQNIIPKLLYSTGIEYTDRRI